MDDFIKDYIAVCDILGVSYDSDYLYSLRDTCKRIQYLTTQVYHFLGGSDA